MQTVESRANLRPGRMQTFFLSDAGCNAVVLGHSAETGTERFKTVAKGAPSKLRRMVNEVLCDLVGPPPPHGLMRMFGSGRMERVCL